MKERTKKRLRCQAGPRGLPAVLILAAFLTLLFGYDLAVCAGQLDGPQAILRVGFSSRVFPDVDQRDAKVAMELWTRELARGMGLKNPPVTTIFRNSADLVDAVKNGNLTIVTLPATEYLQVRDRTPMIPIIVAAANAGNARQYVLIVRKDSGIRSVSDLRNKDILIPTATKFEASHIWLHVLLLRELHRNSPEFFRQVRECSAASQSIMGVFFKKVDAAIVSRGSLDASTVLNPQIGKQLLVLAESKPLHGDITCVPATVSEKLKRMIENAALHLHETASGKQIFTLFQIDRVIPFKPSYLSGLEELLRERNKLMVNKTKR
jgi:phosphonate transport system substrate-binding protein